MRVALEAQISQIQSEAQARDQQRDAAEAALREELRAASAALDADRLAQDQQAATAQGQGEQLRFALAQKEKQFEERAALAAQQEQEIKGLLKQLANLGDSASPRVSEKAQEVKPEATYFEVMFALEGALGLEFQRLAAPYIVTVVHPGRVATGLGIRIDDELVMVGEDSVTEAPWADLVQKLKVRPIVARFRRPPTEERRSAEESGLMASVSTISSSLLEAARSKVAVPGGQLAGAEPAEAARLQALRRRAFRPASRRWKCRNAAHVARESWGVSAALAGPGSWRGFEPRSSQWRFFYRGVPLCPPNRHPLSHVEKRQSNIFDNQSSRRCHREQFPGACGTSEMNVDEPVWKPSGSAMVGVLECCQFAYCHARDTVFTFGSVSVTTSESCRVCSCTLVTPVSSGMRVDGQGRGVMPACIFARAFNCAPPAPSRLTPHLRPSTTPGLAKQAPRRRRRRSVSRRC